MSTITPEMHTSSFERTGAWLYLDEVMHRVLNDYTAMLSTVRLASSRLSESESGQALNELTRRLGAAAMAFRALSPPLDASPRQLDEALEALCATLTASTLAKSDIRLTLVADPVCVDAQQCWKICLVVSEMITNAARHAFPTHGQDSIVVELSIYAGVIRCAVIDNGSAPAMIVPGRGSSILEAIATELRGIMVRNHTSRGSTVVLLVPLVGSADCSNPLSQVIPGGSNDQH